MQIIKTILIIYRNLYYFKHQLELTESNALSINEGTVI